MKNFNLNNSLIDKISESYQITDDEKLVYLRYVAYLTPSEQKQLQELL